MLGAEWRELAVVHRVEAGMPGQGATTEGTPHILIDMTTGHVRTDQKGNGIAARPVLCGGGVARSWMVLP